MGEVHVGSPSYPRQGCAHAGCADALVNAILREAFHAIRRGRGRDFTAAVQEMEKVLASMGETDIANQVMSEAAAEVSWQEIADLLGILMWSTTDNGSQIMRTAESWLHDMRDERRVAVALNLDAYPFLDRAEMERVLTRVAKTWPSVRDQCLELIRSRQESSE